MYSQNYHSFLSGSLTEHVYLCEYGVFLTKISKTASLGNLCTFVINVVDKLTPKALVIRSICQNWVSTTTLPSSFQLTFFSNGHVTWLLFNFVKNLNFIKYHHFPFVKETNQNC